MRLLVAILLAGGVATAALASPRVESAPPAACRPGPSVQGVTEGRSLPGTVAPSTGTLRAQLLLVHAADAPPDATAAPPTALVDGAARWFRTVSYGRLTLRVETLARWLSLPGRSSEYAADPERYLRDAVAAADPFVDFSAADVVYLAPSSGTPETRTSALLNGFGVRADGREIRLWVPWSAGFASSENTDPWLLIHETGHLLGLPDLYVPNTPSSFHRWDVMAARYPAELIAWHRWKLGWLEPRQVVCLTRGMRATTTLTPLERAGGRKAVFVRRGRTVHSIEVRARLGYDGSSCESGVLVSEIDQTPFRRAPVRIFPAQRDEDPPRRGCSALWNAPFDVGRGEQRTFVLPGLRVDVLGRVANGGYRVRVSAR